MEDNPYREALAEHVQRVVDAFPELPAEQRDRLTALLRDDHTPYVLDQLTALADDGPTDAQLRDRLLALIDRRERQAEHIRRVVDKAPPLSSEQISKLRGLLPCPTPDQMKAARDDDLLLLAQAGAAIAARRSC